MIKKILGLLIIGLFSVGYSVNAGYTRQIGTFGVNPYSDSYDIKIDENGTPYSSLLGIEKKLFIIDDYTQRGDRIYYRFWYDGLPYIVSAYNSEYYMQGNITRYFICDEITSIENSSMPGNCTQQNIGIEGIELLSNFLSKLTSTDYYYFDLINSRDGYAPFCFSSSEIGKSICFYEIFYETQNLTGGINMPYRFNNISDEYLQDSPSNGGEEETEKPITTHPCMTLNELFALRPQYNTGLCYSSDKIRNGTSFETTTQQSIYELYPTYNDFRNDLNLYQNYCGNYVATQSACQNAFTGKQAEYSLISKLPNNVNDKDLYNYCDLALNYDRNTSTCVINSGATTPKPGTEPTYEDIINAITNQSIQNQAPTTGTVFDELCEEGDEDCLQNIAVNRNILESLQNIYEKITSLFEKRNGVEGLIPDYIMRLIFLTLFFTILLKK